jgi:hypothetical protein
MRTYLNSVVASGNVFGFGQDRVVASWSDNTCDRAAQHLLSRHASQSAGGLRRALKRRGLQAAAMAGAVLKAKPTCLAITGPQWQPVRRTSPALVTA